MINIIVLYYLYIIIILYSNGRRAQTTTAAVPIDIGNPAVKRREITKCTPCCTRGLHTFKYKKKNKEEQQRQLRRQPPHGPLCDRFLVRFFGQTSSRRRRSVSQPRNPLGVCELNITIIYTLLFIIVLIFFLYWACVWRDTERRTRSGVERGGRGGGWVDWWGGQKAAINSNDNIIRVRPWMGY